ncbi:hypothetical protein [Nocardioides taihuensis]|uniref:Uncharacterized protein n=1 Tax=Nocardioides taihuensis TaxID=1835606 RepID=A0ABW0BII4_9ACTN
MTRIFDRRTLVFAVCVLALVVAMSSTAWALGRNSVNSRAIKNGAVKTVDLATDAVTSAKVRDGSVDGADLADGGVQPEDLSQSAVGASQLGEIITVSTTSSSVGDADGTTNGGDHGTVWTQANCPGETRAISGGAEWVEPTSGSVDTKDLYLHTSKPVADGWYARGIVDIGAQGMVKLRVYVSCLLPGGIQN